MEILGIASLLLLSDSPLSTYLGPIEKEICKKIWKLFYQPLTFTGGCKRVSQKRGSHSRHPSPHLPRAQPSRHLWLLWASREIAEAASWPGGIVRRLEHWGVSKEHLLCLPGLGEWHRTAAEQLYPAENQGPAAAEPSMPQVVPSSGRGHAHWVNGKADIINRVETWFGGAILLHGNELIPGSWETLPGEPPRRTWVVETLQGT